MLGNEHLTMMAHNTMEVVEEGILESISRPNSSNTRYSIDYISRPSTEDSNCKLERLPSEDFDDTDFQTDLDIEDVVDSDQEEEAPGSDPQSMSKGLLQKEVKVQADLNPGKDNNNDVDPKVAKGFQRIKHLDILLEEAAKKEKDAKEERRKVERELRTQLRTLLEEKSDMHRRVGLGVQQLLALCSGDDRQQTIEEDTTRSIGEGSSAGGEFSPVFQTQINIEGDSLFSKSFSHSRGNSGKTFDANSHQFGEQVDNGSTGSDRSRASSAKSKVSKGKKNHRTSTKEKKSFIERNIKLAAHAGDVIALTEEEQKRLDELLSDESDLFTSNPFSTPPMLFDSTGFCHDQEAFSSLMHIDAQLKDLIPEDEYSSICFTPRSEVTSLSGHCSERSQGQEEGTRSSALSLSNTEEAVVDDKLAQSNISVEDTLNQSDKTLGRCGEGALRETSQFREAKQRLFEIERQLKEFQSCQNDDMTHVTLISKDLLRRLLDVNSRATSSAMTITEVVTGRLSVSETSITDDASVAGNVDL